MVIWANEKGWMYEKVMMHWIKKCTRKERVFSPAKKFVGSGLNWGDESECKKISTNLAIIPEGLKNILQPLGLVVTLWAEIFKHQMRQNWENWIQGGMHFFTNTDCMQPVLYEQVANWMSDSWKNIDKSTIIFRFFKLSIIKKNGDHDTDKETVDDSGEESEINDEFLKLLCSDSEDSEFCVFEWMK